MVITPQMEQTATELGWTIDQVEIKRQTFIETCGLCKAPKAMHLQPNLEEYICDKCGGRLPTCGATNANNS